MIFCFVFSSTINPNLLHYGQTWTIMGSNSSSSSPNPPQGRTCHNEELERFKHESELISDKLKNKDSCKDSFWGVANND